MVWERRACRRLRVLWQEVGWPWALGMHMSRVCALSTWSGRHVTIAAGRPAA